MLYARELMPEVVVGVLLGLAVAGGVIVGLVTVAVANWIRTRGRTPLHIVTGYPRSGTSMMMGCLVRGGVGEPVVDPRHEDWQRQAFGPEVNPRMYEPAPSQFRRPDFPACWPARVLKVMPNPHPDGLPVLPMVTVSGGIRVVVMRRDPEAIVRSWAAVTGASDVPGWLPGGYEARLDELVAGLRNRLDVIHVEILDYDDVIHDPVGQMRRLRDAGWPIDPDAAAGYVDPDWREAHRA